MEGACGKILDTENPAVVIKKVHRRNRAQHRTGSLRAEQQAKRQESSRRLCEELGCELLYVPRAWGAERFQYKMDRIQVDKPIELMDAKNHRVFEELKAFYSQCRKRFIFPADFELYEQPDGRVAMVDFDKFGFWKPNTGEITFPWGLIANDKELLEPLGLLSILS
jgi:hypothetical protein